jgi:drug/metabolite transporter (DMT)-like permease
VFTSIWAAHLAGGAVGALPGSALQTAQDSVGAAVALSARSPQLTAAVHDAFMAGLHVSALVVAGICFAGAVGAAIALPGRLRPAPPVAEDVPLPAAA